MATITVKHATKTNAPADPQALVDGVTWDTDPHVVTGLENVPNVDTTNASNLSSGTVPAARMPAPTASTLGGVQSITAVSHNWINSISTAGVPTQTQPAFTDISGSVAASQMPALTGDVTTTAGAVATTLATVNSNVGTFGGASTVPVVTVNAKGLVTAVTTASIVAGVTSVNGQTGALTGILSGVRLAKTAAYSVASGDVGKTIALGGAACYTLTFNAPSGYAAPWAVSVFNEDTSRGKIISLNGTLLTLWPLQTITIFNDNNTWQTSGQSRWKSSSVVFNVDPTNGKDDGTTDGFATGAAAFQTIGHAISVTYQQIDCAGVQPTINVPAGVTVTETVTVLAAFVGANGVEIVGIGGAFTWHPASSTAGCCIQVGDFGAVGVTNVTFNCNGNTNTSYSHIAGHQYGVFETDAGVTFGDTNGHVAVFWDYNGQVNILSGATYTGSFQVAFNLNGSTTLNLNGTQTGSGVTSIGRLASFTLGSEVDIQGNVSFSTGWTGISPIYIGSGAIVRNSGGVSLTNVGGAPTPVSGGGGIYTTLA